MRHITGIMIFKLSVDKIFIHTKFWIAVAIQNLVWMKISHLPAVPSKLIVGPNVLVYLFAILRGGFMWPFYGEKTKTNSLNSTDDVMEVLVCWVYNTHWIPHGRPRNNHIWSKLEFHKMKTSSCSNWILNNCSTLTKWTDLLTSFKFNGSTVELHNWSVKVILADITCAHVLNELSLFCCKLLLMWSSWWERNNFNILS